MSQWTFIKVNGRDDHFGNSKPAYEKMFSTTKVEKIKYLKCRFFYEEANRYFQ